MTKPKLLAAGALALCISMGAAQSQEVAGRSQFQEIMSVIDDGPVTSTEIEQIRRLSDVRLVALEDIFAGTERQAIAVALYAQRGTRVEVLRAAVIENRPLTVELNRLRLGNRNIVAIEIDASGTITVYTFGVWI